VSVVKLDTGTVQASADTITRHLIQQQKLYLNDQKFKHSPIIPTSLSQCPVLAQEKHLRARLKF